MNNIEILDCTLRDGGFINDWDFGHYAIYNIVNRLIESNINFLEVGFLHNDRNFDINRTITKHTEDFNKIIKIKNKKIMILAMIILGEADIDNVGDKEDTIIDGIRIVFKKKDIDKALDLAKKVKYKGYEIFLQPASVTDYTNEDMLILAKKVTEINPYAVYIVDTYGLMHKKQVLNYFNILDKTLPKNIKIGFHYHAALMFIKFLISLNMKNVTLAGFDGFSDKADGQYAEKYLSYNTNIDYHKQNILIGEKVKELSKNIKIDFLTESCYI